MRVGLRLVSILALSVLPFGCATTTSAGDDQVGDDDAPLVDAAPGFIDAAEAHFIDAAPGSPDAALQSVPDASLPGSPDAGSGPFCTDDNQCNTSAHECCWKFIPPDFTTGWCTYGNVVPFFGCQPASAPDAGP